MGASRFYIGVNFRAFVYRLLSRSLVSRQGRRLASEGDSRAWPVGIETDVNEIKDKTLPVNGIKTGGKVTWFDMSQYDGLEAGTDYVFGGRSVTMFKVTESGLEEVFDSGSALAGASVYGRSRKKSQPK